MVAIWTVPGVGSIDQEGLVRLNDGRTFDLSAVPGNGYNVNRLAKINAAIQAEIDTRVLLTDLPADDPDRTINPDRRDLFWSDADGTPVASPVGAFLCSRPAILWLTWDGSRLVPNVRDP